MKATKAFEQLDSAESAMAETKVGSDEHELRVQGRDQHIRHEVFRLFEAEPVGELDHHQGIDAGRLEHGALLVVARQALRARARAQKGERMPVEGEHRRHEPGRRRFLSQSCNDAAMPGVDPVKLSDRDGRGAEAGRHVIEGGVELHARPSGSIAAGRRARR